MSEFTYIGNGDIISIIKNYNMGGNFMISFNELNLTNKIVLEVGTGRGGTTVELAKILKNFKGAKLITTDLYDGNFESVRDLLIEYSVDVEFIKTDGCELQGIEENSIDVVVCNYTLCAINSKSGSEVLALKKFKEVLKPKGLLYIGEEYPIDTVTTPMEEVWARKWQLLRASNMLLGELPFNEIAPEVLEKQLEILGFKNIEWEKESNEILGGNCLEFFYHRFSKVLDKLNNKALIDGLKEEAKKLQIHANEVGGMEIPSYKMVAFKE